MSQYAILESLFQEKAYSKIINIRDELNITPLQDPESSFIVAASHFMLGDYKEAEPILSDLYSTRSDNPRYLSLFAATVRRLGDLSKSKELFEKALSIDPSAIDIQNNYANLLIDMKDFATSRKILSGLIDKYPNYSDAVVNLQRLNELVRDNQLHTSSQSETSHFDDPLLQAFAQDEIDYSFKRYGKQQTHANLPELNNSKLDELVSEKFSLIQRALSDKDFKFALKLCSDVLRQVGIKGDIYELASDALLALEDFHNAEILLLHSLHIDGTSLKKLVNLASFACMRKDFMLAKYYLGQAKRLDSSSELLSRLDQQINDQSISHGKPFNFLMT